MRESIGMASLLNYIIFFILLVFAFLVGTFSYYKAYKVNNAMVSAIEKYEGFNKLSYKEIDEKLTSLGYHWNDFKCPTTRGEGKLLKIEGDVVSSDNVTSDNLGYKGYCVYVYDEDTKEKVKSDRYDSYEVTTIITFQFPIVQDILKLRVSARSARIYNFQDSIANKPEESIGS